MAPECFFSMRALLLVALVEYAITENVKMAPNSCVMSHTPSSIVQRIAHLVSMIADAGGDNVYPISRDHA